MKAYLSPQLALSVLKKETVTDLALHRLQHSIIITAIITMVIVAITGNTQ